MIELTATIRHVLPALICILIIIGLASLAIILLCTGKVQRIWAVVAARVAGVFLLLPICLLSLFLIAFVGCNERPRLIVSPDRRHVAEYSFDAGFLGRDATNVIVRKSWAITSQSAFSYFGPSGWDEADVKWIDNNHLRIRYYPDPERSQDCSTSAAGIVVVCEKMNPRTSSLPAPTTQPSPASLANNSPNAPPGEPPATPPHR